MSGLWEDSGVVSKTPLSGENLSRHSLTPCCPFSASLILTFQVPHLCHTHGCRGLLTWGLSCFPDPPLCPHPVPYSYSLLQGSAALQPVWGPH